MTRSLVSLAALLCFAAPAFADACDAATEAATRAALDAAEASGRRTATVRITCDGERQTFVLHRRQDATGTTVSVRQIKSSADGTGLAGGKITTSAGSMTKIIRVGE